MKIRELINELLEIEEVTEEGMDFDLRDSRGNDFSITRWNWRTEHADAEIKWEDDFD